MWQLDYPWLLLLLPLPWFGYRYLPAYQQPRSAVRVPFFAAVSRATGQQPRKPGISFSRWQLLLNLLVWVLLCLAVARPVRVEPPIEKEQPVRDLMLAIDISQSMETTDFTNAAGQRINRLNAVKEVVRGFIERRKDDRLGLIVFGSAAYPQAPLTLDHDAVSMLLDETGIGMAGPNTAIGDAIGLALKQFAKTDEPNKVLILLTDGNDTASAITPEHAASMAAARGIVIHTIGIGDPTASGEERVNLQALQQIAEATGGRFFRAGDRSQLDQVYASLDQLTPHQVKTLSHQPKVDLFWWPLGLAMGLLVLAHMTAALAARVTSSRHATPAVEG